MSRSEPPSRKEPHSLPPRHRQRRRAVVGVFGTDTGLLERAEVAAGQLPLRYGDSWRAPFLERVEAAFIPGMTILDVGSGKEPTIPPRQRPPGCHYIGLDVAADELRLAPEGSYDEIVVGDVTARIASLQGRVDLIVSWQVFEHIKPLERALENMHAYLRPGGRLVAQLSGTFAIFALLSRIVPHRLSVKIMDEFLGIEPDTRFPTEFHKCYHRPLDRLLSSWEAHEIVPRYKAGRYFYFCRPLLRLYLIYENWIARAEMRNLATHYIVVGVR
jgi:SAM-dependent methyltransferase